MRKSLSMLAGCAAVAAALLLAGCGQKKTAADTNSAATDLSAGATENGTASDITATDATVGAGAEGNMVMSNASMDSEPATNDAAIAPDKGAAPD